MTTPLSEIEARAEKATPGPWLYRPRRYIDDWGIIRAGSQDGYIVAQARDAGATDEKQRDEHRKNKTDPYEANAQFIAHAREDIPDLLQQVRALEAENEKKAASVACAEAHQTAWETRATEAEAQLAKMRAAVKQYLEDYRPEGCSDPNCNLCKRSKAAEVALAAVTQDSGEKS